MDLGISSRIPQEQFEDLPVRAKQNWQAPIGSQNEIVSNDRFAESLKFCCNIAQITIARV
jgi:hypothetical protein